MRLAIILIVETVSKLSFDEKLAITRQSDKAYNGKFYLAVHTTGIFCIPSCKAKTPLPQNVEFFDYKEEALKAGFRGCKRCRSEFYPHTQPLWLTNVLKYMEKSISLKISEKHLEEVAGVDISTLRRYFKEYIQKTPLSYFRSLKLKLARKRIKSGEDYRDVGFSLGYDSVSGFRNAFYNEFTINPGEVK